MCVCSNRTRALGVVIDSRGCLSTGRCADSELVRAVFPVHDAHFHSTADDVVHNADDTRYSIEFEEEQREEGLAVLPATYLREPGRPAGETGGALEPHMQALEVKMGKLQQQVQHEVASLKAGQQQAQQDISRLQATQDQVLARLESVLAAVEKLQGGGRVVG